MRAPSTVEQRPLRRRGVDPVSATRPPARPASRAASGVAGPSGAVAPPSAGGEGAAGLAPSATRDRLWTITMRTWAGMLVGYALLDKGFAYLHLPGTPLFIGELALLPILLLVAVDTPAFRGARLVPLAVLGAYTGWAGVRFAESLPAYRLDAVRDSAMWYYAIVAALVIAWFRRRGAGPAFEALVRFAERLIVPLLVWTPVAALAERNAGETIGPIMPLAGIPALTHKVPNLAPMLTMAVLWIWQDRSPRWSPRRRVVLFTVALIDIGIVGTQTRGGFLAALGGIAVGVVVLPGRFRVRTVARRGAAVCLAFFIVAFALDLKVPAGRDVGVRQLTNNTLSVVGLNSENTLAPNRGSLDDTTQWRKTLWRNVITRTFLAEREVSGWGFGPNLGDELGFENQLGDGTLRSPHNSHLSVFARLGLIGLTLWALLWLSWGAALIRLARRRRCPDRRLPVAAATLVGMVVALHVNAYFDPAYESPQAGAWLWAVFGAGCGLLLLGRELTVRNGIEEHWHRPRWGLWATSRPWASLR